MCITDTIKDKKVLILSLAFILLAGCDRSSELSQAQGYATRSQEQYERAVSLYRNLISKEGSPDKLHFQLGELYYLHGNFTEAVKELSISPGKKAKKPLGISYYRLGDFTSAFSVFEKEADKDDESLYYYGLTCEKLNLFDQALEAYRKIKNKDWSARASERVNIIEKGSADLDIKDISPSTADILARAPSEESYPQAGALILSCDENIEVLADNMQVSDLHYVVKILNERGKEDFSESHIDYDSTYEKVELEYARTIRPDGKVVEVGKRHIRDVSKYMNFPLYSNARVFIISFPEIVEGSSIEYKLKIYRSQLLNKKDFVFDYPLQVQEPIIAASFSISAPREKAFYIKNINEKYNDFGASLRPAIEKSDKAMIYRWRFKNIPQIIPEPNMPAEVEINPTILVSTFKNWQDIYNWWSDLSRDKIKADAAIKEKVRELIKDKVSQEEKAREIYSFCAQKIRYVAVEYGQAGYEPHKAEDIFSNKYGDCKDKAILLVTMLREAGLSAAPVLISTKEDYNLNEDFPAVFFNHCIAVLFLGERTVFLDPTAQTCFFGDLPVDDQARRVLVFRDKGYKIQSIPLYAAKHNLLAQRLRIKVNPDASITGEKETATYGMYDQAQRYWVLYTPPELIEQTLKEKIQEVSIGATLGKYRIRNVDSLDQPLIVSYSFSGPEYFTSAGSSEIMPQLASLDAGLVARETRKYPMDFGLLYIKETIFEIEIPAGFVVKYIPVDVDEESPWLDLKVSYTSSANRITMEQVSEMKKNLVSQEEYPGFKAFFEGLAKKLKQRIILERKGGQR